MSSARPEHSEHPLSDMGKFLVKPKIVPELEPEFRPASLAVREYRDEVERSGRGVSAALCFEREGGFAETFGLEIFPPGHHDYASNFPHLERLVNAGVWGPGAWKVHIGLPAGMREIGEYIENMYQPDGARAFDAKLMGEDVYEQPFTVEVVDVNRVPATRRSAIPLGRFLKGNRIGVDLGASDRKGAAVVDGKVIFSDEVAWDPSVQNDPKYHLEGVADSIDRAAARLPHGRRLQCVGVSSAGIYINNYVRVASLFKGVKAAGRMEEARGMFLRLSREYGVPLEVVNDGAVTALAGSMETGARRVMGIAMGSSVAGGVTSPEGCITTCLDEFAFFPIDYQPGDAPFDTWARDCVASMYLSQQALPRLIRAAGLPIDTNMKQAEQLVALQAAMSEGGEGDRKMARRVYETLGTFYGYAIPHYMLFNPGVTHVLVLGRVTSGEGGDIIVNRAREVLQTEFPDLYQGIKFYTPSGEQAKRHGQAIAAASLVPDNKLAL